MLTLAVGFGLGGAPQGLSSIMEWYQVEITGAVSL